MFSRLRRHQIQLHEVHQMCLLRGNPEPEWLALPLREVLEQSTAVIEQSPSDLSLKIMLDQDGHVPTGRTSELAERGHRRRTRALRIDEPSNLRDASAHSAGEFTQRDPVALEDLLHERGELRTLPNIKEERA